MSQWADHFVRRSEVRESAGIFLVFIRDEENGFFKFVVMEFLKCDGGGNGGENRDVWRDKFAFLLHCSIELIHRHTITATGRHTRTQFDGEAWWKFHLNKLPQLVEVLERRDDLQHIQQPEQEETMSQLFSFATFARISAVRFIICQEWPWLFLLLPACVKCSWVQKI